MESSRISITHLPAFVGGLRALGGAGLLGNFCRFSDRLMVSRPMLSTLSRIVTSGGSSSSGMLCTLLFLGRWLFTWGVSSSVTNMPLSNSVEPLNNTRIIDNSEQWQDLVILIQIFWLKLQLLPNPSLQIQQNPALEIICSWSSKEDFLSGGWPIEM